MYDWLLNQQKMTPPLLDIKDAEREYQQAKCTVMTADETVERFFFVNALIISSKFRREAFFQGASFA